MCGMYEDAAAAAAFALKEYQQKRSLPLATHAGAILRADHDVMRETMGDEDVESLRHCAGAVLIQAYHGLGRWKNFSKIILICVRHLNESLTVTAIPLYYENRV